MAGKPWEDFAESSDKPWEQFEPQKNEPKGGFKAAVSAGVEGLKGATYGLAGRTGIMDVEEAAKKQEETRQRAKEIFKPTEEGWTEAPWTKFKETLGGSLPYMAAPVIAGALAPEGAVALGAAGLASAAQFAGTNLARQVEEDKGTGKTAAQKLRDTDLTSAIMAAPVQAAFDVFGLGKIPGIRQVIGAVAKDVGLEASKKIVGQTFKEAAIDYAKSTGKAIGAEGITEAAQQVLERMQAGLNITDANARKEYWENFVGGAVLGGAMAPAGRYMERRGEVAKEQAEAAKAKEAADLAAQQKAAEDAQRLQAERLTDPAYLDDLTARVDAFNKQRSELQVALKGKVDQNDAVAVAERKRAKVDMANFMRDDANQALLAELTPEVTQAMRRRQVEKQLSADNAAQGVLDLQGGEAGQQQDFLPLQPGKGVDAVAALKDTSSAGEGQAISPARQIVGRAPDGSPIFAPEAPAPLQQHPQAKIDALIELRDRLSAQSAATDDLNEKVAIGERYRQVGAALDVANKELAAMQRERSANLEKLQKALAVATEQGDAGKAGGIAKQLLELQRQQTIPMQVFKTNVPDYFAQDMQQRAADLSAQNGTVDTRNQGDLFHQQQMDLVEEGRQQNAEAAQQLSTPEFNRQFNNVFEKGADGAPAVKAPPTVPITRDADAQYAQIEQLIADVNKARSEKGTARRAGEKEAASSAFQREREAMAELDRMTGGDSPYSREVVRQKFEQQSALDTLMDIAERIRQGQYLGYKFGADKRPEGMVEDLKAEIADRQQQLAGITDKLPEKFSAAEIGALEPSQKARFERLTNEITQLQERLNYATTQKQHVADKDQGDLAATTKPLLYKKADAARADYIKAMLEEAATHRAARGLKGITQEEALKAASEVHDLLETRFERKDGETNAFIQGRLKEISDTLSSPERVRTKVEAPLINTQYAATEAKKVAEQKGETATTLSGELRRHSEFVQGLLDKALKQDMPADVRDALEKAQIALQEGRVTRDLLDATEAQAARVIEGRMVSSKESFIPVRDPYKKGKIQTAEQTQIAEEAQYPRAIHDALAAMEMEQQGQRGLFDAVSHKDAVAKNNETIAGLEADIKLIGKSAFNNWLDAGEARKRITAAQQRIKALKQRNVELLQEEKTQRAAADQIARLGSGESEPLTHEFGNGFVPDPGQLSSKSNVFSATLGHIRATAKNFANSPIVQQMRAAYDKAMRTTTADKARENMIAQLTSMRKATIDEISVQLQTIASKLADNAWLTTAYPMLNKYANQIINDKIFNVLVGTERYKKAEFNETRARLGIDKLQAEAARLKAELAADLAKIDTAINAEAKNDPRVIAIKRKDAKVAGLEEDLAVRKDQLKLNVESAIKDARAVIEREAAAMYDTQISEREGKISGLQAQLARVKDTFRSVLEQRTPSELLKAGMKFDDIVEHEYRLVANPVLKSILDLQAEVDALRDARDSHGKGTLGQRANKDPAVKQAFKDVEKLQKRLENAQKSGNAQEVSTAQKALEQQQAHADEMRRIENAARDAAYRAANEKLSGAPSQKIAAQTAPLRRKLELKEAEAAKITKKLSKNKELTPLQRSQALANVNNEIYTLQSQINALEGKVRTNVGDTLESNKSVEARRQRLEGMVADTKLSDQRRARAQQALDILNARSKDVGRAIAPVTRQQSAEPNKLRVGDTLAQQEEKNTAGTGEKGKYLSQQRGAVRTKSDARVAAELRVDTLNKQWKEESAKASDMSLTKAERLEAADNARELLGRLNTAEDALAGIIELEKTPQQRAEESKKQKAQEAADKAATAPKKGAVAEDVDLGVQERGVEGKGVYRSSEGGDFTVLHADAREAILEGNITAALQNISTTAKSAIHRLIAAKLLPFVESTRVAVRQDIEPGGEYHHADNRILMHPNYLTEEHFLHEVLHAATLQVLSKPVESLSRSQRAARARLEGMYNRILVDSRFSGEYGKKHLNEFVAELHTNAGLREKLDSIGKPESLLKRIVRAITEFFTGPKDTPKESAVLMHAVETLFSESGYGESGVHEKSKMAELGEDITEQRGTLQRAYEERSKFGLAARQAVADMRAALRETFSLGDKHTGIQAQSSLLAADSYIGNSQAVAEYGAPKIEKDSKGILRVVFGASKSGVDVMKAIGKIPAASAKERMNIFQGYVTALRAEEVGWDALSFDKAAEKQKAAKAAMAELDANPEMKKAVEAAHAVYRDLNRGMIDFLDATHALPADVVASMRAAKNYIPFYRVNGDNIELFMPDGHPRSIGDIRSLPFLHALDTGDQKLMDFPNAMMKNIALLTNLGVMNLTNRQIGYHLMSVGRTATTKEKPMQIRRGDGAGKNNVLRWIERPDPAYPKDDGQRYIILDTKGTAAEHIPTPLLTQAVAGSYATFPAMLEVAGTVSNLLRSGVTRVPLYAFKQLFKDAFNASVSGNLKSNPIKAVAQVVGNFANIMRGADVSAEALRKAGVLHSNVFSGGKGDLNKVALQMAGDQQGYINRGLAYLDKLAMSADAAARTQAYKDALASGASEAEAVIHARELANFTRHGSESSVQFLARAIPFFNASIQGLDVLQRSMRGKMPASELYAAQEKFFNRAMGLAGVAMMYAFLMEDDPEWQRMSLRDKISYIHLPRMFGEKEPLRLPAPFETGMMFYSMPIAMYEAMKGEFTKKDWGVIKDVVLAQAPNSGSFMPLIGKGVYDVARNYNSGTGAPIVPKSKEGLDPIYQFNEKTTELAKRLAEGLNDAGVKLSPMELEYLSQTYLGGIPVAVATLSNGLFSRLRDDAIAKPTSKMSEMPFIGFMFQNQKGTDDIEHVYEIAERVKKVQNTISKLKNTGRPEDLREYLQEHKVELALASPVGAFTKAMGTLQQNEEVVRNHPKMSAEAKSQRLDFLQEKKQEVAERLRAALTSAEKRLNASLQT